MTSQPVVKMLTTALDINRVNIHAGNEIRHAELISRLDPFQYGYHLTPSEIASLKYNATAK